MTIDWLEDAVQRVTLKTIAERAGVSIGTIRTHIRHILEKAGVHSQAELIAAIAARL